MSNKQIPNPDVCSSYMDAVKVKISEKYKPPPKINLVMTYTQRMSLNKHIQDNMPNYEFVLEESVLHKLKEWRTVRNTTSVERKLRLDNLKKDLKLKEREKLSEAEEVKEKEVSSSTYSTGVNTNISNPVSSTSNGANNNASYLNMTSLTSTVLIPTQTSDSFSNILTPIPLNTSNNMFKCKPEDRSPFNISEFEADTSSPFDNVALKSINDMEELAKVLKIEDNPKLAMRQNINAYSNYNYSSNMTPSAYTLSSTDFRYIPNTNSYVQSNSGYNHANGYYLPSNVLTNSFPSSSYQYASPLTEYSAPITTKETFHESRKSDFRSVPDIVKALEVELEHNGQVSTHTNTKSKHVAESKRAKSTDRVTMKFNNDELKDPFNELPTNLQDLVKAISSMGFPLPRVARTCKILGDDNKKIIEHLLAMSELLDLGFSEKNVSEALILCDNDRDKALDKLVS